MGGYGYMLSYGSNMISDGSELLLLVPSLAGIVGSIVLPVLGAVPDGAIVLFSGLGPDAQQQLSVGVGALAGALVGQQDGGGSMRPGDSGWTARGVCLQ